MSHPFYYGEGPTSLLTISSGQADNTLSSTIAFVPVPSIGTTATPVYGVPVNGGPEIR